MTLRGVFVTGTGTGVGKTEVSVRLCHELRSSGQDVFALKPIETGVVDVPEDAVRLAEACGRPELAHRDGFYRAPPPVAPWAATLAGHTALDLRALQQAVLSTVENGRSEPTFAIVEGAGGPLVPLTETQTVADLCLALGLPAVVVARDALGTLSHTISACESLTRRGIQIAGVILNRFGDSDESQVSNEQILRHWLTVPIYRSDALEALAISCCRVV